MLRDIKDAARSLLVEKMSKCEKRTNQVAHPPKHSCRCWLLCLDTSDDGSGDDTVMIERIQQVFNQRLNLVDVDNTDISDCLHSGTKSAAKLEGLAVEMYRQQEKAERVFHMLDEAGKGVIVMQDLQRVYSDVLGDDEISDDDIVEMVQEVDRSGDGILYKEDMIRIARQVHL